MTTETIMGPAFRARLETTILLLEDTGHMTAEQAQAVIRNLGPRRDLDVDVDPFAQYADRKNGICIARMNGLECARNARESILSHCDDSYREVWLMHQGVHPDDFDAATPDPMAADAVY